MVTLVSANTRQIATGHILGAVIVGFAISLLWYANSSKDRDNRPLAGYAYATGAAVGTWVGFSLAAWFST
jgi:ABC-type Na+ efflux pump permease subunit